jgi:hypothetical protein
MRRGDFCGLSTDPMAQIAPARPSNMPARSYVSAGEDLVTVG